MQKQAFLGPIIGSTLVNVLVNTITERLIQKPSVPVDRSNAGVIRPEIREAVAEAITKDPVVLNELNGEAPHQSRVIVGSSTAGIATVVAGLMPLAQYLGLVTDQEAVVITQGISSLVALWGVGYAIYGRLASGLKPLFNKKAD